MTLEEVKERISEGSLYRDWITFINDQPNWKVEEIMDEVAKRYATEAIKADRERVADNATYATIDREDMGYEVVIDKESIINLPIELP